MTTQERRIEEVEQYFQQKELGLKPIPAAVQFRNRLTELTQGRRVPVALFNCLDFSWRQGSLGEYPQSVVLNDTTTANVAYYQREVVDIVEQLQTLGNPAVSIIIPDSELFDERPFNHSQTLQTRQMIRDQVQIGLSQRLSDLEKTGARIITWSEYCAQFVPVGLKPEEFTKNEYDRIGRNPDLVKKVREQAKDSRKHFTRRNLDPEYINTIPEAVMIDKTRWYCAMYMGEAIALSISRAIVLNLEDSRVKAWYLRGSSNLPILTPVDPNSYYGWRNNSK